MAYFEWGDDLIIDNGPIDQDHKKLVALVNELHSATSQGMGQTVVAKIMSELVSYTQTHLTREEHEMELNGFPGLEEHRKTHVRFMNKLNDLQRKYAEGSITVASQLSTTLRDWLSIHIRRSDKELRRHIDRQRRK